MLKRNKQQQKKKGRRTTVGVLCAGLVAGIGYVLYVVRKDSDGELAPGAQKRRKAAKK